jgi:hypothetical protein
VLASSTFLYLAHAKEKSGSGIPVLSKNTVFEVVSDRKVYNRHRSSSAEMDRCRQALKGPRGMLFNRRPRLD